MTTANPLSPCDGLTATLNAIHLASFTVDNGGAVPGARVLPSLMHEGTESLDFCVVSASAG